MIKFYYTSVKGANLNQDRPDLSLGGHPSLTQIPNNRINNLFSDLSLYSIKNNLDSHIAIIIKNDSEDDLSDVNIWFEYPTLCQRKYKVAAVDLVNGMMESIGNVNDQPYSAEFYEADSEVNKISLGAIDAGMSIGVWIKSSINRVNIDDEFSNDNMKVNGTPKESDELINIIVEW